MTGENGMHKQMIGGDREGAAGSALSIIHVELMETIRNAQLALEDCVDGRGGTAALKRAGVLLHQAGGALRMTETFGAALLVEEMELACDYVAALRSAKGREDGLDALTRSVVQLPVYIERLLNGGRDIALVLLPMLNDLRAARGEPLLSEGTLLLLNLAPSQAAKRDQPRAGSGEDPLQVAKRLRPRFQLALLGWIKGGDSSGHLDALSQVAAALQKSATRDDMYQLWWIVSGVLEALQNGGLETSIAIKRLLGQADRQIRYVIDEGLEAFDNHPVDDLLNNLLYYVARSSKADKIISEIRAAFNLAELLPGDEQVEEARDALSAPSAKLMETVAAAIRDDLANVKDVLDIFVRTGMNNSSELLPQLDMLKKISDTLGVLGLGELRGDVEGEIERLRGVVEKGGTADDQLILDIAAALLQVEDRLDQQLQRLTSPARAETAAASGDDDGEFQKVTESVMRECIINLARIKETISQSFTAEAGSRGLDSIPSLIQGIKSGLLLLDKPRAREIVDRVGRLIKATLDAGGPNVLDQKESDRLADVIVSIEYYMETVKAGRSEPWYMLDNAEACLAVLDGLESRLQQIKESNAAAIEPTQKILTGDVEQHAVEDLDATAVQETVIESFAVVSEQAGEMDPEIIELFIEEAKEEIASIKRSLPVWTASPDDLQALITVRRSFHTLKGSGRMVGAERIGEYCWAVEDLLNRLINRTLLRTPPMVDFVQQAVDALPELIEQLEVGTRPKTNINQVIARANAFADGDPNAAVLTVAAAENDAPEEAERALEMDPVLYDIFSKETAGHLQVIRDYLESCEGHQPPFAVTDKLHRACHTLHGSANMANVERGVAVTAVLNRFVRRLYDNKVGFQPSGLDALRAAARAIETIVGDINNPVRDRADYSALIEHIAKVSDSAMPGEAAPTEVLEQMPAAARVTAADEPAREESADAEYDAEIASIFTEESAELLEEADRALLTWSKDRSPQPMQELKRHLHTLKGGARMAGITAMGNLSHELETLLISLDEGRVKPTPAVEDLLQRSIDELHRMRDSVIAGKAVRAQAELEQRIQQANAGFEVTDVYLDQPAAAEPGVEAAVTSEFTAEPFDAVSMVIVDSHPGDDAADLTEKLPGLAAEAPDEETIAALIPEHELFSETEMMPRLEPEGATESEEAAAPEFEPDPDLTFTGETAAYVAPEPEFEQQPDAESETEVAQALAPETESGPESLPAAEIPETESETLVAQSADAESETLVAESPDAESGTAVAQSLEAGPEAQPEPEPEAQPEPEPEAQPEPEPEPESEPESEAPQDIAPAPAAREPEAVRPIRSPETKQEFARIDADLLEDLLNAAGEISIYHSRLSQQINTFDFHVEELEQTVARLRDQLRKLEIETEAQIMHTHQETVAAGDFDPLELDRYSNIQQLSRALSESSNDLSSLKDLLQSVTAESEGLLVQQSRVTAELQDGLMRTRMVPFQRHVGRLTRLVRQAAAEANKRAELVVEGASGELDRQVLDKMLPPFEHMLRNSIVHGIESPAERQAAGKPGVGRIAIRLHREGAEMVIDVADDGAGLDVDAIRRKAYELDLLKPDDKATDEEIIQLILTPGFSTASTVTQSAGRGVGMDVVANEVKKLGGSLRISSVTGQGSNFTVRLPFTLAITQALIVRCGEEVYALPLPTVEGVARIPRAELEKMLSQSEPSFQYGEQAYSFRHLGMYLGGQAASLPQDEAFVPVILIQAGEHFAALLVDEMLASREIVVKSVGPQLASIRGVSGATILGDGSIVLILDILAYVRSGAPVVEITKAAPTPADDRPLALVVDDSITVRRVTERFLARNGMRCVTAKDGLDAISVMQEAKPDIILLDIEMPRMDGYEFASHVRNDERVADVPIIMITSRVGDKHRARAIELGVNDYVGKPYQDAQLLEAIRRQLEERGIELQ